VSDLPWFLALSPARGGILWILCPFQRIFLYVLSDTIQFIFIADDMLIVVTLPQGDPPLAPFFVGTLCGARLKNTDNCANRLRWGTKWRLVLCRGVRLYAPTNACNDHNSMDMIGHHHIHVQKDVRSQDRGLQPPVFRDLSQCCQLYLLVYDLAEQTLLTPYTDCHRIGTGLAVVISLEANGTTTVLFRIEPYLAPPQESRLGNDPLHVKQIAEEVALEEEGKDCARQHEEEKYHLSPVLSLE